MRPLRIYFLWLAVSAAGAALGEPAKEPSARQLARQAREAEKKGETSKAYLLYSQAAARAPRERKYWLRAEALRTQAVIQSKAIPTAGGQPGALPALLEQAAELVPEPSDDDVREARRPLPPMEIQGRPDRFRLDLRGEARALFEQVARRYGLDCVFDGDYPTGGASLRLVMEEAGYRDALYALETITGSFLVPISQQLFLVVKDTQAKRNEVENNVALAIPLPEPVTVQEAQELARAVQSTMEITKMTVDSSQRTVIFRDKISKVRPAQELFRQLLFHRPEVLIRVEFLSVSRNYNNTYGIPLQNTFTISPAQAAAIATQLGSALGQLRLAITGTQILANATQGFGTQQLLTEIRTLDGQAAQFHVGQKYPIVTASFLGDTSQPGTYVPPPNFSFEDLGVLLKVTPKVHGMESVSMELEAEYKVLGAGSFNGIPIISTRKFGSRARLRFGESIAVSGLVADQDQKTRGGVAGLASVPFFGALFSRNTREQQQSDTLLVITPILLSMPASEIAETKAIWTGSEGRPR